MHLSAPTEVVEVGLLALYELEHVNPTLNLNYRSMSWHLQLGLALQCHSVNDLKSIANIRRRQCDFIAPFPLAELEGDNLQDLITRHPTTVGSCTLRSIPSPPPSYWARFLSHIPLNRSLPTTAPPVTFQPPPCDPARLPPPYSSPPPPITLHLW